MHCCLLAIRPKEVQQKLETQNAIIERLMLSVRFERWFSIHFVGINLVWHCTFIPTHPKSDMILAKQCHLSLKDAYWPNCFWRITPLHHLRNTKTVGFCI